MAKLERLQKFLAHQGYGSRRSIEKMIGEKRIAVNDVVVTLQGTKIDPDTDIVKVEGELVQKTDDLVYFWLNKPVGVVSSRASQQGEPTVLDYVSTDYWIYPVGRLDKDSHGLLLMTNDGTMTHKLTHPKFHIDKTYIVTVKGHVSERKLQRLRKGIRLEEGMTAPAQVDVLETDNPDVKRLKFVIHEGKNRQIRRMCGEVNLEVIDLERIAFGPFQIDNLSDGTSRRVTPSELEQLKSLVGM